MLNTISSKEDQEPTEAACSLTDQQTDDRLDDSNTRYSTSVSLFVDPSADFERVVVLSIN